MNRIVALLLTVLVLVCNAQLSCNDGSSLVGVDLTPLDMAVDQGDLGWTLTDSMGMQIYTHRYAMSEVLYFCIMEDVYNFVIENVTTSVSYAMELDTLSYASGIVNAGSDFSTVLDTYIVRFSVVIVTDQYPAETSWHLANMDTFSAILTGTTEGSEALLDAGHYKFEILDTYGNGICCGYGSGSYTLYINDEIFYESNGQFGEEDQIYFNVTGGEAVFVNEVDVIGGNAEHIVNLVIDIVADNYPNEMEWWLKNRTESINYYISDGTSSGNTVQIGDGVYEFFMDDSYGDGICCSYGEGHYSLSLEDDQFYYSDGTYGGSDRVYFFVTNGSASLDSTDYDNMYGTVNGGIVNTLSAGAVVGIVFGCIAGIILLFSLCCAIRCCVKQSRAERVQFDEGVEVQGEVAKEGEVHNPETNA